MKKYIVYFGFFLSLLASMAKAETVGLKISAAQDWITWGDYILGQDFKQGFEELGYQVEASYIDHHSPTKENMTDIDIYMHGFVPFNPQRQSGKKNVLYLYYPLETSHMEKYRNLEDVTEPDWYSLQTELWNYNLIAVASPTYQKQIEKFGIPTIFTPQFTDPKKFFYEYDEEKAHDILFVGRPGYDRISALWAIESGYDVSLYGDGWQNKAPGKYFKGSYIDNGELHKYYASAKIVLNDTREDMKKAGFISNRVFDVTASGGFLISDYMPEIEQFYGDAIPMFKTKEELVNLLNYYLNHPKERKQKAEAAQKITLAHFTNKIVAQKILSELKESKYESRNYHNALIIKAPWSRTASKIGDFWLGKDLEAGLINNGFDVKTYYFDNGFHTDSFYEKAGNLLYLQFKYNHTDFEDSNKAKIMYLYFPTFVPKRGKFINTKDTFIYNTDAYLNNELEYFDLIATPAKAVWEQLKQFNYATEFVPQFTNPKKFHYEPKKELQTDLLFVGSCWYDRISALFAVELGYNISVYGLNWQGKIPQQYVKGNFIDNQELNKYYSSAKIVLSDHAEDLAQMGLVINRLYDASAAGAFIISEYSPYIEEIFGDAIPLFSSKEEFKKLVDYYLSHPEERKKKAQKAQKITLEHYTNDIIAEQFKDLFLRIKENKK